jgi:hypothetical protein
MKPSIEHRRIEADRALMHRAQPVEHLDRRGHGDEVRQDREDQAGIERLASHEHVVAPDEEADHRDGDRRPGDEFIAEDLLAGEGGDDLADHTHARQDHDVDRRMRIEPKEMLEQDRIAAQIRIEHADAE